MPEFGFDDGFYANYEAMRGRSVAYAASFGDYDVPESDIPELRHKLHNFNMIGLREKDKLTLVKSLVKCPVDKVIDPTLLLTTEDYTPLIKTPEINSRYLLLYSRRDNPRMQEFAESMAKKNGWKIVEISLNAKNEDRHIMRYDAGVEEFLGLVKNAEMVITNSFHGMIFAVQFKRPFFIFSRNLCDTKIAEVLELFGLDDRLIVSGSEPSPKNIDYIRVHDRIFKARKDSLEFLKKELTTYIND